MLSRGIRSACTNSVRYEDWRKARVAVEGGSGVLDLDPTNSPVFERMRGAVLLIGDAAGRYKVTACIKIPVCFPGRSPAGVVDGSRLFRQEPPSLAWKALHVLPPLDSGR